MANFKVPDLIDGTAIPPTGADLIAVWNSSLAREEKKLLSQFTNVVSNGYILTLYGGWETFNPANSTTYFIGNDPINSAMTGTTTYGNQTVRIPNTGTVKSVFTKIRTAGAAGSAEAVNHFIRVNDTTDFASASVDYTGGGSNVINLNHGVISQVVNTDDFIALKIVTPAWVSAPTGVRWYCIVYIE